MRQVEIRDAGKVAGTVLGGGVSLIEDLHRAIAVRSFTALGPSAESVRVAHDRIAGAVYGTIAAVFRSAPRVVAAVGAATTPIADAAPLDSSPKGNAALGALNGLWGDRLAAAGNADTTRHVGTPRPR